MGSTNPVAGLFWVNSELPHRHDQCLCRVKHVLVTARIDMSVGTAPHQKLYTHTIMR